MKPKIRGYKEGVIKEDLSAVGGYRHKKGDLVRYKKYKKLPDKDGRVYGDKFEYHYLDQNNSKLVRTSELLVDE